MFRIEHNVETGEIKEIELTPAEIKEIEKMQLENVKVNEKLNAEAQAKASQKSALLEKLGITEDEAKLLLGGN